MNSGPAGFVNAPVTKVLVTATTALSLFAGITQSTHRFDLTAQAILKRREVWRLLTSAFLFTSPAEVVFGLYLIYYFRILERQSGSSRYGAFATIVLSLSSFLQVASLVTLQGTKSLSPGPYGFIFACFVPFMFDIPISTRFSVLGVRLSDKSFIYLAGLQLLFSGWRQSLIPGVCGIVAGLTYRSNFGRLRNVEFPAWVNNLAWKVFSPIVGQPNNALGARGGAGAGFEGAVRRVGGAEQRRGAIGATQGYTDQLVGGGPALFGGQGLYNYNSGGFMSGEASSSSGRGQVSEENIEALVTMGFDQDRARRALIACDDNLAQATHLLLDS